MLKKILLITLSLMSFSTFAAEAKTDLCTQYQGLWEGNYQDEHGLFPDGSFPIRLVLVYNKPYLLGYTLSASDEAAGRYGIAAPNYLWAQCSAGKVSQLYLINSQRPCAGSILDPKMIQDQGQLNFESAWQSPMIDTQFRFSLKRDRMLPTLDKTALMHALKLAEHPYPECHENLGSAVSHDPAAVRLRHASSRTVSQSQ